MQLYTAALGTYRDYINKQNTGKNGGLTWIGHDFSGPGNKVANENNKFIAESLPTNEIDWIALEHDVQYHNAGTGNIEEIGNYDLRAAERALNAKNSNFGGKYATSLGLYAKHFLERTWQGISGSSKALYPNSKKPDIPIDWFTTAKNRRKELLSTYHVEENSYGSGTMSGTQQTTGGDKRTDEQAGLDSGGTSAKKPNYGTAEALTAGTSIPGIGLNADAGDATAVSMLHMVIPRPIDNTKNKYLVFSKNHEFLSYGLQWKPIKHTGNAFWGTTSLAEIPVDRCHLYLTVDEIDMLPPGSYIDKVVCKVVLRGVRTAYETATTQSELATLNQNKWGVYAVGLNKSVPGVTKKYTTVAIHSMEPQDVKDSAPDTYVKQHDAWYSSTSKPQDTLPCSFMNLPTVLQNYYTLYTDTGAQSGYQWPRFNRHVTKFDANAAVGTVIVNYEYSPKIGLLTRPLNSYETFYWPDTSNVNYSQCEQADYFCPNGSAIQKIKRDKHSSTFIESKPMGITSVQKLMKSWTYVEQSRHVSLIDLSHVLVKKNKNYSPAEAQPSLHVGVYPVPRITAKDNNIVPTKFLDVEAYYTVETSCTVKFGYPTVMARFKNCNVNVEKEMFTMSVESGVAEADGNYSTCYGKHSLKQIDAEN
ncbi:uncharacterized protein LOC126897642 [Daktulosphaira vitifoliae]|uniref:uncharacterized protein LOC126897642 n=1 Tax=Daktulosphaira vitifoliae TaxID=58002 RepID=UPI0021AA956F|nr:uncharacterized protein LOC126897642 [Daktulosphaira vitifoliae]XP_050527351.1 uncharacterized protein LOC126897642 [Daktulosphaira vitifoliae]XP_050527352.1 uncharacterized protein LOC126897642 [Daktulosphaira vitifoliae]XP_050527353.1 uncharacterized protein LOC126897642 [Daktulosphaira vitifoliae]XP_050527354.1 uncharacterized protein LOC126897642 [Daktulosphaira vitifoliae]XP_050527355.1 uncharacterized protein LOC126897642 [Daktulosphaira vitifoliae]XP_050527356.1 uncharacterized prot